MAIIFSSKTSVTLSESVIYNFADCRFKGLWKKMLIKQNKFEPVKRGAFTS